MDVGKIMKFIASYSHRRLSNTVLAVNITPNGVLCAVHYLLRQSTLVLKLGMSYGQIRRLVHRVAVPIKILLFCLNNYY